MTAQNIIRELDRLPLIYKLLVIEQTLKTIRREKERTLKCAVDALHNDYKTLTAFTKLDKKPFYEAR